MNLNLRILLFFIFSLLIHFSSFAEDANTSNGHILVLDMDLIILPGTGSYLAEAVKEAESTGAKAIVIKLNTPGGMLQTTQDMIQTIFSSKVPVIVYVTPAGATATSAGVFITMAAHVAGMAPGTSLGAAHPVSGGGQDIEGDMRKKAENMTTALVRSITEQRGRNVEWVEKAVRESESITAKEALENNVVDIVAKDIDALLSLASGKEIKLNNESFIIPKLEDLKRINYQLKLKDKFINILANPQIIALLWLAAVTGLFMELKNPGMIIPGTVGVICLALALSVSQIIPINQGGVLLLILGACLIAMELFVPSGFLGVGGGISIVLGLIYLVDVSKAPGLEVGNTFAILLTLVFGGFLLLIIKVLSKELTKKAVSGLEGLIGKTGVSFEDLNPEGRIFLDGTYWNAEALSEVVLKGSDIVVKSVKKNPLKLVVTNISEN